MHNTALDETFFVQHFVKGLKQDLRGAVESQDPEKIERAVHLATIQEDIAQRPKFKFSKQVLPSKQTLATPREAKGSPLGGELWKARQTRDYRRANNLCFYCAAPFTPAHLDVCEKRPKQQVHTLTLEEMNQ